MLESTLHSAIAAMAFAGTFAFGRRIHPLRALSIDRRSMISFCGGMASAYVFVHVMPELDHARSEFVTAAGTVVLPNDGLLIHYLALVGFLVFYALDHLRPSDESAVSPGAPERAFKLHIGGLSVYVWLLGYLLVHNPEESPTAIALYAIAISVHLLATDHDLRQEYGKVYDRHGRYVLAAMALLGWGSGMLVHLPEVIVPMILAFVSGGIIVNSLIMELPTEKDGRFKPFILGGLVYGIVLLPMS